jgi:hypothetical protein
MVGPEVVQQLRQVAQLGWGSKRIGRTLGIARNTVKRFLRGGAEAEVQVRPKARRLDAVASAKAVPRTGSARRAIGAVDHSVARK